MLYRAEILGRVPKGLTHNDVYASILSMLNEDPMSVQSTSKRRLAGNMISVICVIDAADFGSARRIITGAASGVSNFSFDVIGPKEVK